MSDSPSPFLTTKELAELLRLKERKIYELAASGDVPCSRATGKLLFPRREVEAWLARNGSGFAYPSQTDKQGVFVGSHDPLLEWALRESACGLATFFDGSQDGLDRFANEAGIAAALHLYDADADDWNRPQVEQRLHSAAVVLVQFVWRSRGFVVAPDNPLNVQNMADIESLRVVARQPGSGSQILLTHLLVKTGFDAATWPFVTRALSETDAAIAVLEGRADVAFGLLAMARQFRLGYVPMIDERVDLLIDRRSYFEPPLQKFLRFCRSSEFSMKAQSLGGYEVGDLGEVVFNSPT